MTDLNNFFAKRDKKKSKGIVKFTTINEIEKNLLKMDKKRELEKKYTDEEWSEFEEKLKDYSGLKILNTKSENDECDLNELGSLFDEKTTHICPWKVIEKPENEPVITETMSSKELEAEPTPVCNVYIPPHLRNKPSKSTWAESKPSNKEQQHNVSKTLEINDNDVFPMLTTTSTNMLGNKRKEHDTLS